jgi:hypothetical protein
MITCNLCGGLGNQLFQIFTTISYSITNKIPFYFPNKKELTNGSILRYTYWDTFLNALKPFLKINYDKLEIIREQQFSYNELPSSNPSDSVMLVGYFQSYKYFEMYKSTIYNLLKIENKKKELKNKLYNLYNNNNINNIDFDNTISMHFRLGDYKKYPSIYRILDENYYMRALQIIQSTSNNLTSKVIYFCEDESLTEVEEMISKIKDKFELVQFERAPSGLDDWEELLYISICKYNIIANSTFSWWGAYLNTNEEKIVCCPKEWFMPQTNNNIKDLFLDDWIKVIIE